LKNACDLNTPKGLRDATIISFLWETWARASEVITVEVNNLNLEDQEITFFRMKVNDWHTPAFGPDLRRLLEMWLSEREKIAKEGTKTIFVNIRTGKALSYTGLYEILKSLEAKTGIKVSAHPFRRGGARHHAAQGRNAREGLEQGGWRSWEMYWRYTRGVSLDWFKRKRWNDENEDVSVH
jgi:site-specific recombinase XerD